jgi:transposase
LFTNLKKLKEMSRIYVGCDVSKAKIDFTIYIGERYETHRVVENTIEALNKFIEEIENFSVLYEDVQPNNEVVFIAEYTGIYNNFLLNVLLTKNIKIALLHPYSIQNMGGLNRDKNDKVDSKRIAEYGRRFYDKLKFVEAKSSAIEELKTLNSLRTLFVKNLSMVSQSINESKIFKSEVVVNKILSVSETMVEAIEESIEKIEKEIALIIKNDAELNQTLKLLTSVPGIGKVTATELIIYTENFTKFDNAKKLGSYCGVVPFERSSGIFKGKRKVSKKANKSLKTLLHLGATSTVRTSSPFADYYIRKVSEGKNPMLVINAIRNKIIKAAFAVVKNKKPYNKEYVYSLAS